MQFNISKVFMVLDWFWSTLQVFSLPTQQWKLSAATVPQSHLWWKMQSCFTDEKLYRISSPQEFNSWHLVYRLLILLLPTIFTVPGLVEEKLWLLVRQSSNHITRTIFSQSKFLGDLITSQGFLSYICLILE